MNKKGRVLVIVAALFLQVILGALYGFSMVSVPAWLYFMIWCVCAAMICKTAGAMETV